MLDNLKKYKVILASNSPRRKELLAGLGVDYEVRTLPDVDESYPDTLQGADIPLYIAKEKADAYRNMLQPGELMITADTVVWLDGRVLGKPKDREDALCMLRDMSGPHPRSVYRSLYYYNGMAAQLCRSDGSTLCCAERRRNNLLCR